MWSESSSSEYLHRTLLMLLLGARGLSDDLLEGRAIEPLKIELLSGLSIMSPLLQESYLGLGLGCRGRERERERLSTKTGRERVAEEVFEC